MTRVLVVGGGAAGIMAAWRAASLGASVTLLEKTGRLGTKILISGGGKCNICHDGPIEDVLRAFRPAETRFLRPAVYRFPNAAIVALLTSRGLEVYTRPDGRIFPVRQTAKEVVGILRSYLADVGVDVRLESPVRALTLGPNGVEGVRMDEGVLPADRVVVAVGGSSYPNSGTTGDGWAWAREVGHTIVPVRAALAPIYLTEAGPWMPDWSGIALRDVVLKARLEGREADRFRGDLLFTHHGVSGPCALAVSRAVAERWTAGTWTLDVDLRPDDSPEEWADVATEFVRKHPQKRTTSLVDALLPESLQAPFLHSVGVHPATPIALLERKARNRIVEAAKGWRIGTIRSVPLEKGECVAGGVALDEVDTHTMASRLCRNLYLCGEILDVAGPVGGYNLQAAFATGFVAGESAAGTQPNHP